MSVSLISPSGWHPASWRSRPARQLPAYRGDIINHPAFEAQAIDLADHLTTLLA